MRQVEGYRLWIGHAGDLRDLRPLLAAGMEAVVELADNEPLAVLPRELIRLRFPLSDGGENPPWLHRYADESVASLLKHGIPTLVMCSAGMSRSVCIASGAVAVAEGLLLGEALNAVVSGGRGDVSPGLLAQLHAALGY